MGEANQQARNHNAEHEQGAIDRVTEHELLVAPQAVDRKGDERRRDKDEGPVVPEGLYGRLEIDLFDLCLLDIRWDHATVQRSLVLPSCVAARYATIAITPTTITPTQLAPSSM
jgi:hypothetical protein